MECRLLFYIKKVFDLCNWEVCHHHHHHHLNQHHRSLYCLKNKKQIKYINLFSLIIYVGLFIISKEAMFSVLCVSPFVRLLAGLCKNDQTYFHETQWWGAAWAKYMSA